MGTLNVSEAISYTEDIEPYTFVQIFSGVGSGKSYFINDLVRGHEDHLHDGSTVQLEPMTVLTITSRKSKVGETLSEKDLPVDGKVGRWHEYNMLMHENEPGFVCGKPRVLKDSWGIEHTYFQRSVCCTNAFIESYLQHLYHPDDMTTHLWELFDAIVIDEVHSIVSDANYQSAPFYVHSLANEFLRRHRLAREQPDRYTSPLCKHLIVMTGTPHLIADMSLPKNSHTLDLMDRCINVVPKNIRFITYDEAKRTLKEQIDAGEKAVYFANRTQTIKSLARTFASEHTAISFSDEEKRKKLETDDEALYQRMMHAENHLAEHSTLPNDIQLFFFTSRNKEGISIKNEDIRHLYIESHVQSDVQQMCGRIRSGVENMYFIIDALGHDDREWPHEDTFSQQILKDVNTYFERLCSSCKDKLYDEEGTQITLPHSPSLRKAASFIEGIHKKYPYIRYNYITQKFEYYSLRKSCIENIKAAAQTFAPAQEAPEFYQRILQEWFPASVVHPYCPSASEAERKQQALDYFAEIGGFISENRYSKEDIDMIRNQLNRILGLHLKSLSSLLSRFCEYSYKHSSGRRLNADGTPNPSYSQYYFLPNSTSP